MFTECSPKVLQVVQKISLGCTRPVGAPETGGREGAGPGEGEREYQETAQDRHGDRSQGRAAAAGLQDSIDCRGRGCDSCSLNSIVYSISQERDVAIGPWLVQYISQERMRQN